MKCLKFKSIILKKMIMKKTIEKKYYITEEIRKEEKMLI